jgi:isopentenyl-diphosphate delta-isomerase type 1
MSLPIQIVDENDQPIGQATKQEAWKQGLIHRTARIMIENKKGQLLLQHRDPSKEIFPDAWDNSVAGHVDAGETYEQAALREMEEEIGLKDVHLQEIGYYFVDHVWKGRKMKRFSRVYKAQFEELPTKLEAGGVDDVRWWNVADIKQFIKDHPDKVSDGLEQVIARYY